MQLTQFFLANDIRVAGTVINPLILVADVAARIDDTHYVRTIGKYPAQFITKTVHKDFPSQLDGVNFFTERGLYKYLTQSSRPKAEPFQEWVYDRLCELRTKLITDAELATKIANRKLELVTENMSMMTVSSYDDARKDSCPRGLSEFYIARFIANQRKNYGKMIIYQDMVPEAIREELYEEAKFHFRHNQADFRDITDVILNKYVTSRKS